MELCEGITELNKLKEVSISSEKEAKSVIKVKRESVWSRIDVCKANRQSDLLKHKYSCGS